MDCRPGLECSIYPGYSFPQNSLLYHIMTVTESTVEICGIAHEAGTVCKYSINQTARCFFFFFFFFFFFCV